MTVPRKPAAKKTPPAKKPVAKPPVKKPVAKKPVRRHIIKKTFMQRLVTPARKRAGAAAIRASWMSVFGGLGFMATYAADSWMNLGIPIWVGLPLGAIGYGFKKFFFPDTTF